MNRVIVAKFGGSSLADANQIRKVVDIVRSNPLRFYVVVSAPGKRYPTDYKVTDLLYGLHHGIPGLTSEAILGMLAERFGEIVQNLDLSFDLRPYLRRIKQLAADEEATDELVSRGEYICAQIVAKALGERYTFLDAKDVIKLSENGRYDYERSAQDRELSFPPTVYGFVIPGFYGSLPDGSIKTFSRGGSDLSGAIIAGIVGASLYENWTDVSGIRMTDPRIVPHARQITEVTYRELRALTYMGASVLHDEVIFPLRAQGIRVHVRNTNEPHVDGTFIVPDPQVPVRTAGSIVGIAGKRDFTVITVEKLLMNNERGFDRKLCEVFEKHGVSIEHTPGDVDIMSVVVASDALAGKIDAVCTDIMKDCTPDNILVEPGMALICTVGIAMARTPGVAGKLFHALGNASINIRMIDQGASELSIMVGVDNTDYETAVRAIYDAFA